ncbi:hypothetical protein ACQP0C_38975 [Nocardia sp. CA-129566]|uniref:hypothetical protein n=1 Tax=Nocardia sp. CA-129566 TaxID=3239976 RepID=UPI003D988D1A
MHRRLLGSLFGVDAVSAAPAGLLAHRQLRRRANAHALRIDTPNGIAESGFVTIGGIEQWIEIRGEDLADPVLLELRGGPGATNTYFANRTRTWERHFTIARWICAARERLSDAMPRGR